MSQSEELFCGFMSSFNGPVRFLDWLRRQRQAGGKQRRMVARQSIGTDTAVAGSRDNANMSMPQPYKVVSRRPCTRPVGRRNGRNGIVDRHGRLDNDEGITRAQQTTE